MTAIPAIAYREVLIEEQRTGRREQITSAARRKPSRSWLL
jgi:hypothetical protein